jgi:hypothetical protein
MRSAKKINLNVKLSVAKVHDRALRIIKNLLGKRVSIL